MNKQIIITPELLKKIAEEAPKSEAAIRKLERAKIAYERNKESLKRFFPSIED